MDSLRPSDKLRNSIILSIRREEVRRARATVALASSVGIASVAGIVLSLQYAVSSLTQSGFFKYASLIFSDADILTAYWQEFFFSLVETFPLFATTCTLMALAAFLVSLRLLATNVRGGLTLSPL